jgi:hypothetical protein
MGASFSSEAQAEPPALARPSTPQREPATATEPPAEPPAAAAASVVEAEPPILHAPPETALAPPAKRARLETPAQSTDLSDRSVAACAHEAIVAVHRRAVALGLVDAHTAQHPALLSAAGARSGDSVLDVPMQQALHRMLAQPLTAMLLETALRRHATCERCTASDVLRVGELARKIFLMVPLSSRGRFARASREWAEVARSCWRADDYLPVEPTAFTPVARLHSMACHSVAA